MSVLIKGPAPFLAINSEGVSIEVWVRERAVELQNQGCTIYKLTNNA